MDVKEYETMPEEAAVAQLESEARPLLEERRQAAAALLRGVAAFSQAQVRLSRANWRRFLFAG